MALAAVEVAGLFVDLACLAACSGASLEALCTVASGVAGGDAGPVKVAARPLGVIGEIGKWSIFIVGVGISSEGDAVPLGATLIEAEVVGGLLAKRC